MITKTMTLATTQKINATYEKNALKAPFYAIFGFLKGLFGITISI